METIDETVHTLTLIFSFPIHLKQLIVYCLAQFLCLKSVCILCVSGEHEQSRNFTLEKMTNILKVTNELVLYSQPIMKKKENFVPFCVINLYQRTDLLEFFTMRSNLHFKPEFMQGF